MTRLNCLVIPIQVKIVINSGTDNPLQSGSKNIFYYAILLTGAWLLGLAGESIYAPAMPAIAASFAVPATLVKMTITFFIIGKTISMFLCSPIAEGFARRQFLLFGLLLFSLGGLICTISPGINTLLLGRLIQGFGCSITILMGRAIVNDNFASKNAAQVFSYIFTGNAIGVFLLPVFGGYLATYLNWRWIFLILTCYGAVIFTLMWWFLPKSQTKVHKQGLKPKIIIQNYKTIVRNGPFWGFLLCVAMMTAGEKAYTTSAAFLFISVIGISRVAYGYLTAGMWAAHLAGTLLSGWLAFKYDIDRVLSVGIALLTTASILMVSSILLGWENAFLFAGAMAIYMLGTGFIIVPAAVGIVRPFPNLIGFATAFAMAIEFAISSTISYSVSLLSSAVIPIEIFVSSMGILTLVAWLLFLKGKRVPAHT